MSFYLKVAGLGFCLGAGMELFMIHTGFYEKVVEIEAEKRRAAQAENVYRD